MEDHQGYKLDREVQRKILPPRRQHQQATPILLLRKLYKNYHEVTSHWGQLIYLRETVWTVVNILD